MTVSRVDYLAFSFHKLAPFGVGVLYAREPLLERSLPFLYGGDMVAEGQVTTEHVEYGALPWKFAAGTPNVLGVIASAQALRLLTDLALDDGAEPRFEGASPLVRADVEAAMGRVHRHVRALTDRAVQRAAAIPGLRVQGRPPGCHARRCWPSPSPAPIRARSRPTWTGRASRRASGATAPAWPTVTWAWSGRVPAG